MRPAWNLTYWSLAFAGVVSGLASTITTGTLRRAFLLGLVLAALGIAGLASLRGDAKNTALGGAGYSVPPERRIQVLHLVITVLYNVGIGVVAFAALARIGTLPVDVAPGLLRDFPAVMAVYLLLLAIATQARIEETGGVRRTWYTRFHGYLVMLVAIPVVIAAIVMLSQPSIDIGIGRVLEQDLQVMVLVAILGVGTQLFLAAGLPTIFDMGASFMSALLQKQKKDTGGTTPVMYALGIAIGGAAIIGFILTRFDLVGTLGGFKNERVVLLLLLVPVALGLFLVSSALQIYRESRRGLYQRKISTKLRNDIMVYGLSGVTGLAFSTALVLNLMGRLPAIGPIQPSIDLSKDLIVLSILSTLGPIGFYLNRQSRRVANIEARLPDFLNDLAETRRAGLTLAAALQSTALSDYGDLTPEIRKMAHQVAWGLPFNEALEQFAARMKTALVKRSAHLIIEAGRTGGSVSEILKAAAKDAYEIKGLTDERRVNMMTYLIVIYVVFFVFLTVIAVLDVQFIPKVLDANEAVAASESGGSSPIGGGSIDRETLRFVYFNAGIVQAIGNGLVGGVLSESRVTAGFRHAAIMVLATWIIFRVMLAV